MEADAHVLFDVRVACSRLVCRDAKVILAVKPPGKDWRVVDSSETILHDGNPSFLHVFKIPFVFHEMQYVRFEVVEGESSLGAVELLMSDLVASRKITKELKGKRSSPSFISLYSEESLAASQSHFANIFVSCQNLDKKDLFGKADPFFVISRQVEGNVFVPCFRSLVCKKTLSPVWDAVRLSLNDLCNGDITRVLKFEVFDWNRSGKHELIGFFTTTIEELSSRVGLTFTLTNPAMQAARKNYKGSGTLSFNQFHFGKVSSMRDYLDNGFSIVSNFLVDYSSSNGVPQLVQSNHNPKSNVYTSVFQACSEVLSPFCKGCFGLFGTSAKLKDEETTKFFFAVSAEPVVKGNLEAIYRASLNELSLSGPLLLCESVETLMAMIGPNEYGVIIVVVNRVCDDVSELRDVLEKSDFAASVIIVGVGAADFTRFANFPQFCVPSDLHKLLDNVPNQLIRYFSKKGINPVGGAVLVPEKIEAELFSSLRQSRAAHLRQMDNMRASWKL